VRYRLIAAHRRFASIAASPLVEGLALVLVRVALGGVFWRSGQTKMADGAWFTVSDTTYELFRSEYARVPLPPEFAAVAAAAAEHLFPALLAIGLATRFSALALLGMTLVIQVFVYPDAWWPVHSLWAALALVLIVRGGGMFSLDALLARRFRQ
jgi:putative oxidoreductase